MGGDDPQRYCAAGYEDACEGTISSAGTRTSVYQIHSRIRQGMYRWRRDDQRVKEVLYISNVVFAAEACAGPCDPHASTNSTAENS